jgi:hydroxymethylbilane synthase
VVGTSSLRREAQLRARFAHLKVTPLRGNLDTRLQKLDDGQYDAIVLAAAGLKRLGASERIRAMLPPADSLPAVGQGALAIETLAARTDVAAWLMPLADRDTATCIAAERTVSRALGGSCQVPLAAYAVTEGNTLRLRALVAAPDGSAVLRAERTGPIGMPEELGLAVAADLRRDGAERILAAVTANA